jgi:hypothetical protein
MWRVGSTPNSRAREALRVASRIYQYCRWCGGRLSHSLWIYPEFLHPGDSVKRLMPMQAARSNNLCKLINRNVVATASHSASWRPRSPPSGCRPTVAADRRGWPRKDGRPRSFILSTRVVLLERRVTLAGSVFEFCATQDLNYTTGVFDGLLLPQNTGCAA